MSDLQPIGSSGSPSQSMLSQMALALGGTQAIPQVQQSQYLADAIKNMSGAGQNLRTPAALGTNLLAEALLQYGRHKSDQALMGDVGKGQSAYANSLTQGTGLDGAPPPAGGPPAPAPDPTAPPGPAAAAPPAAGPAAPPLAQALQNYSPEAIQTIIQEDPSHAAMIASVIRNRMNEGHETDQQVVEDRNQFGPGSVNGSGEHNAWLKISADPNNQPGGKTYNQVAAEAGPILSGEAPPAAPYTGFYSPTAAQKFGEGRPKWDDGSGKFVGGNEFFSHPYGGFPHAQPPGPPVQIATGPAPSMPTPQAGQAQPFQIASNAALPPAGPMGVGQPTRGPDGNVVPTPFAPPPAATAPPPPQAGPVGANTPPPMAQAMQQPPQAPQGPPTGPQATPQEIAQFQADMRAPPGSLQYMAGLQLAQSIQARAREPLAPPKDMMWGPGGRAVPMPGTQFTQLPSGAPGDRTQATPFGQVSDQSIPNAMVGNQLFDPQKGAYATAPGLGTTIQGQLQPGTVTATPPGGAPTVVQGPIFNPETARSTFLSSPELQEYNKVRTSAQGLLTSLASARGAPNGILGTTAIDTLLQSYGVNPRSASAADVAKSTGFSEQVAGTLLKAFQQGGMPADGMRNILNVVSSEVRARQQAAQQRMDSDTAAARSYDPKSTGVPGEIVPPLPAMPSMGPAAAAPARIDPQAAAVELQRRGYRLVGGRWTK